MVAMFLGLNVLNVLYDYYTYRLRIYLVKVNKMMYTIVWLCEYVKEFVIKLLKILVTEWIWFNVIIVNLLSKEGVI